MIIQKFGGTSLGSADRMKHVANLINDQRTKVVVLSAVSGTTNKLSEISEHLYKGNKEKVFHVLGGLEESYREMVYQLFENDATRAEMTVMLEAHWAHIRSFTLDMFTRFEERTILAQGELISSALLHRYCQSQGMNVHWLPALDFMRVDQIGEPDDWYIKSNLDRLLKEHSKCEIFITQGYICRNHFGDIDNLKRGGSDYSASIIGAALGADEVQIWTDIDGMHNNDPRIVKETRPIERLTFDEAAELAYFGAKILHPTSIVPARKSGIPVWLKNTMQPEKKGTLISDEPSGETIKAVAAKDGITAIKVKSDRMLLAHGFLRKLFEVFERHAIAIDMITTSEVAVSLTIDRLGDLKMIVEELEGFGQVEVEHDQCIICIVGHLLQEDQGHASKIFDALSAVPIRMISYGGSKNNISILVDAEWKEPSLIALNRGLFNLGHE